MSASKLAEKAIKPLLAAALGPLVPAEEAQP